MSLASREIFSAPFKRLNSKLFEFLQFLRRFIQRIERHGYNGNGRRSRQLCTGMSSGVEHEPTLDRLREK
jgi:hypothetical protein